MKWVAVFLAGLVTGAVGMWGMNRIGVRDQGLEIAGRGVAEKPLEKYRVESLGGRRSEAGAIQLGEVEAIEGAVRVQNFSFTTEGKKVTGLAHIPVGCSETARCPVIVQFRGYADVEGYYSGFGTRRSAQKYAEAGFISLAPDFLGYGGSDMPSGNIFEERFQRYTTGLDLLVSVGGWPFADGEKIGIWGHSNGGQVALTVLEATKRPYATTLWAPVTAAFPYSILYYTNEATDGGKLLRRELANFERDYDTDQFNLLNYLDRVVAPVQIHQGTADESVPVEWNRDLVRRMQEDGEAGNGVTYYEYTGADHNLVPSWSIVVERDINFFINI